MSAPILPGSTIGILGGGQLGRMMALSARSLGYRIACLDPDPHCGAHYVVEEHVVARFDDRLDGYLHMADFGTCAVDWPLMDEFDRELSEGKMPK